MPIARPATIEEAVAERTAAIKAAVEKAAVEKAAVEKAAVEKAVAEKAAAEKAAAEKASAEKASAEKAAAEKASAEQAAAEQAAAEKAAAEKATASALPAGSASSELQTTSSAPAASATDGYTLDFGTFVLKSEMAGIKKKIKNAGMKPVVEPGPKRKEQMSRIHVGEYTEQKAAEKMLQKLRQAKAEHFMLQDKTGKFNVYAGSYFDKVGAVDEQLRLAGFGITTELRPMSVQVPTFNLTAGSFKSEEAAARKGAELEKAGVKPTVVQRHK
ncbi:SPOR domain-containing protein [Geomonas subterranea]|nr:SPOR domain-containing protein [Geomonas subterranea]